MRASLMRSRRDAAAARQCFRERRKRLAYLLRVVSTATRASDGAAKRAARPSVAQRRHQGRNKRAEHAHRPTRERERRRCRFTSPGPAQRFLAADGPSASHGRPHRHRRTAAYRATRDERFAGWRAVSGTPAMV